MSWFQDELLREVLKISRKKPVKIDGLIVKKLKYIRAENQMNITESSYLDMPKSWYNQGRLLREKHILTELFWK